MTDTNTNRSDNVTNGAFAQGICLQWFLDTYGSNHDAQSVYITILRYTFGYRKRYGYIKQSVFKMSPNTLKKQRDWLRSEKIIDWKQTKNLTMYKLLEPIDSINRFNFVGSSNKEQEDVAGSKKNITEGW